MSLFGPEMFRCQHKHLSKCRMSNTYECNKCEKQFVIIPAKNTPILPHIPKLPKYPKRSINPHPKLPFDPMC